jgi:hypothetical protein
VKQTAVEIRSELLKLGHTSRDVSVRCSSSWVIRVRSQTDAVNLDDVKAAAVVMSALAMLDDQNITD